MWNNRSIGDISNTDGGFFKEQNHLDSPSQAKSKGPARRHQNVFPLFIRRILNCRDDELTVFGIRTQMISIVGILRNYEVQSTKATYEIEDHTGRINAIYWLETDANNTPQLPVVKEGSYVKVFGSMRTQEGKNILMILKMFPVDNMNQITTHGLEVLFALTEAEKLTKEQIPKANINLNNPGAELANSMTFMTPEDFTKQMGFSSIQEKVYNMMLAVKKQTGIGRQYIFENFPKNQQREVNDAIEFLTSEGHAYSTIDNDHFRVTDPM